MESNRQYNLQSQRSSTFQVPVQIETAKNREFLSNLMKSSDTNKNVVKSGELDISDLDCSGLTLLMTRMLLLTVIWIL